MQTHKTPQPRQALQEVSNTAEGMEVDSNTADHRKPFQTIWSRPKGENQPLSLPSPDPTISDFDLQQALLHSPQFDGSPNTIFKLKLAHLGFVEGSPPGGQLSQQAKVTKAKSPGKDSRRGCRGSGRLKKAQKASSRNRRV